jgi:hypothetical protein
MNKNELQTLYKLLKSSIITFLLLSVWIGCADKKKDTLQNHLTIHVNADINPESNFVKEAHYVFLDNKTAIGNISRVLCTENQIFIHDSQTESVLMYSFEGELIGMVNAKGRGFGEYNSLTDFTYNPTENAIVILDSRTQKLLYYKIPEMSFLKEIKLDIIPTHLVWREGLYFLYNPFIMNYSNQEDEKNHSLYVINDKGKVVNRYFYNNNKYGSLLLLNQGLFSGSNHIYFNNKLQNDIYVLNNGEPELKYNIHFDDHSPTDRIINSPESEQAIEKLLNLNSSWSIQDICESDKFIYLKYLKNQHAKHLIFDKKNGNILLNSFDQISASDQLLNYDIPFFEFPVYSFANKFVSVIEPFEVYQIYRENNDKFSMIVDEVLKQKFLNLNINDNPIIAIYSFNFE